MISKFLPLVSFKKVVATAAKAASAAKNKYGSVGAISNSDIVIIGMRTPPILPTPDPKPTAVTLQLVLYSSEVNRYSTE